MGKVQYENKIVKFDDKFSGKVFTEPFIDIPDNTVVYASCFYQENKPDSHIFREDMIGVKFYNCNLDNVFIPKGNEVIGGTQRKIMVQNDLNDWEVDEKLNPIKPINSEILFEKFGLPVPDPADIPTDFIRKEIYTKVEFEKIKDLPEFMLLFQETPIITEEEGIAIVVNPFSKEDYLQMLKTKDYSPFLELPQDVTGNNFVLVEGNAGVLLQGKVKYHNVIVEGKGLISKDGYSRKFENISVDLKAAAEDIKLNPK